MQKKVQIKLKNSIDELPTLAAKIEELAEKWELSMGISMNLNLVLEEIFTNIVNYGFTDKKEHTIVIDFIYDDILTIKITDDGIAFNPLTDARTPDLNAGVEERQIGGLGIYIVNEIMDKVDYKRIENENILILHKEVKNENHK